MIIELYSLFLGAGLLGVLVGYLVDKPVLQTIGFGLLFLNGVILIPGFGNILPGVEPGVQYKSGLVENSTITNITTTEYTYATFQSHTVGLYLALAAALGFILIGFDYRDWRDRERRRTL